MPSAQGLADVEKAVALKGLDSDRNVQKAFDEIHYITLDRNATADTVVSVLARIYPGRAPIIDCAEVQGCQRGCSTSEQMVSGRDCLFLVDDV